MKLDPDQLRTAKLWAEAQAVERRGEWQAAFDLYIQLISVYEDLQEHDKIHRTLRHMRLGVQEAGHRLRLTEYIQALTRFNESMSINGLPDIWLQIGQAERYSQNRDAARHALAKTVDLKEAIIVNTRNWSMNATLATWVNACHDYLSALYEWALLESEADLITEALDLLALAEMTIHQSEAFSTCYVQNIEADQKSEAKLIALHNTIIAERIRLELRSEDQS